MSEKSLVVLLSIDVNIASPEGILFQGITITLYEGIIIAFYVIGLGKIIKVVGIAALGLC